MAELSPYFDAITAARSMLVDDPFDAGNETISLETQGDLARDSVGAAIRDGLAYVLPYLRELDLEDRELITLYYLSEKPQWCLANIHCSTQTLCSQRLRMARKRLGLITQFRGHPTLEVLDEVLEDHGLNRLVVGGPTTGRLVVEYRKRRSFSAVTDALKCSRPQARKALNSAATALLNDEHEEHTAFGAYIRGFIDQAAVIGSGFSEAKRMKCASGHSAHPPIVGAFRTKSDSVHAFDHVLVSKAALY